jgi:mevalonate kinase
VALVIRALEIQRLPACKIRITSTIPVAAGLGSGAAVAVALIRALGGFLGHPLQDEQVSDLAYEIERIHHGTPSGIDNSVVTYAKPIFLLRTAHSGAASSPSFYHRGQRYRDHSPRLRP